MKARITREWALSAALLLAASFYRPLTFWASNAWDLTSIPKLIGFGMATFVLSLVVFWVGTRLLPRAIPVSLFIASILILALSWSRISSTPPWVILPAAVAFSFVAGSLRERVQRLFVGFLVLILGVAPVIQVVFSHIEHAEPIPIVDLTQRPEAAASGMVEDVLVVVVDSYPSAEIAERWFGHDMEPIHEQLRSLGFETPRIAWSQHTFTTFAIPALLELKPVVDPGVEASELNPSQLIDIIRGDNLFARVLMSAGYEYTHVESGWESGNCGRVDVCVRAPFFDELAVNLLSPSLIAEPMTKSGGGWGHRGTLNTFAQLMELGGLFGDGERDYLFGHILLPHPPVTVDVECELLPMSERTEDLQGADMTPEQFSGQLSCADRLIADLAGLADDSTAVIITADHGTKTTFDVNSPPSEWTRADIAEAFGIFLAYRLPDGCAGPDGPLNTAVMRAIIECATDYEPPPSNNELLIGLNKYRWINTEELFVIEQLLSEGLLRPNG